MPNKPSVTLPDTPPPAPNAANSQSQMDAAARIEARKLQNGRAATMLTGGAGLSNLGTTTAQTLGVGGW